MVSDDLDLSTCRPPTFEDDVFHFLYVVVVLSNGF